MTKTLRNESQSVGTTSDTVQRFAATCALCEMPPDAATHPAQHRLLNAAADTVMTRFGWDVWPDRDVRERIGVWGGGLLHNPRLPATVRYFGALAVLQSLWFASVDAALRRCARHSHPHTHTHTHTQAALLDHPDFEHYAAMATRAMGGRWCVSDEIHMAYGGAEGVCANDFRWFPQGPERDRWHDHLTQSGMPADVGLLAVVMPRAPWEQIEMPSPSHLLAMARGFSVSPCICLRRDWHALVNADRFQQLLGARIHGETVAGLIEQVHGKASSSAAATLQDFGVRVAPDKGLVVRVAAPSMRGIFGEPDAMVSYLERHCGAVRADPRDARPDAEVGMSVPGELVNQWLTRWIPDARFVGWREVGSPV